MLWHVVVCLLYVVVAAPLAFAPVVRTMHIGAPARLHQLLAHIVYACGCR